MDIRRRAQIGGIKKTSSGGGSTTGGSYTVNLNSQWEKTAAVPNPDSTLYDGVYRSSSNYNVNSGVAIMYITIKDCSSFKMYIRSYAESNFDYVMVSQLDKTINGNTTYSDTTLVKAHTRGNQQSGTTLSSYTLVEFTGISSGEHTITVVYRKDGGVNNGDDRGYVLIEKSQAGSGDSGGDDEGGSSEGPINTNNYLTIKSLGDGLTASLSVNACEYCVDGDGNWKSLSAGTATQSISIGHTLSFRGNLTPVSNQGIGTFTISKKCDIKGNCMSMLFGDNAADNYSLSGKNYAFYKLFYNCSNIITVSSNFLPATTLANYCYNYMFEDCTRLIAVPTLSVTTLTTCCYTNMFRNCTSLTSAPTLPATTLASYCYSNMFYGCSSLISAPTLQAKTLMEGCYSNMFRNCTSLTSAPTLPATTLASYCYQQMFRGCTNLTTAPTLPATTLKRRCYSEMFWDCSSLTSAPTLPATTAIRECYTNMFYGCSSLTTAPELPATTLEGHCYYGMFEGCTSLTSAPTLPATTLASYCYQRMFYGCSKLNYIKMLATDKSATDCLNIWVYGVASSGTFVKSAEMTTLSTGTNGIPSGWTVVNDVNAIVDINHYLTIEAYENGLTASLSTNACEYCIDGDGNWKTLAAGTVTESINSGQTLSFRGELTPNSSNGIGTFTISKKCNLKGNCMSMLFGDNAPNNYSLEGKDYAFYKLFYNCNTIVNVSDNFLPATTLEYYCYGYMFSECTNLRNAPSLPATTLEYVCYDGMFYKCTNLTTAPELPATTLVTWCYRGMFNGCSKLNYIKMLATDISATDCLSGWVYNVASSGTFVKNHVMSELPTGTSGVPSGWVVANDGELIININHYLTIEACEDGLTASLSVNDCEYCVDGDGDWKTLAAGTVTESINSGHTLSFRGNLTPLSNQGIGTFTISKKCNLKGNCMSMLFGDNAADNYSLSGKDYAFYKLFYNCNTIVNVSDNFLPAIILATNCYYCMFENCTRLTTAPELPATTIAYMCYRDMFSYCRSLTTAPELPATTLKSYCYHMMFMGCTSLTTAPELPATTLASYCYYAMFYVCTNLTTAPELPATTLVNNCYNMMFRGCSSLTTAPELPATTLDDNCYDSMFVGCTSLTTPPELPATTLVRCCYDSMFMGCTSLTTAPELPATTLASYCYQQMFNNCTSLTTAPELPATTLAYCCYYHMFRGCTSLTTAPELPATTLASYCYGYMFDNCTKLNYIKMLATNISASNCLANWVNGVASSGTFVKHPNMTSIPTGESGIPSGWTVVNDGEESGGKESGGNLITFTIDGTEYQAEEGMTWGEFVNSDYNVNGDFFIDLDNSIGYDWGWVGTKENYVYAPDTIQENYNYLLVG